MKEGKTWKKENCYVMTLLLSTPFLSIVPRAKGQRAIMMALYLSCLCGLTFIILNIISSETTRQTLTKLQRNDSARDQNWPSPGGHKCCKGLCCENVTYLLVLNHMA